MHLCTRLIRFVHWYILDLVFMRKAPILLPLDVLYLYWPRTTSGICIMGLERQIIWEMHEKELAEKDAIIDMAIEALEGLVDIFSTLHGDANLENAINCPACIGMSKAQVALDKIREQRSPDERSE